MPYSAETLRDKGKKLDPTPDALPTVQSTEEVVLLYGMGGVLQPPRVVTNPTLYETFVNTSTQGTYSSFEVFIMPKEPQPTT